LSSIPDRYLPVGPFSRLVGVSPDLLRVWERRYGVPRPARTAKGMRLYSPADAELVRTMQRALARGLPAAEAARLAADAASATPTADRDESGQLAALRDNLDDALMHFREADAQDRLDRLFGSYSVDAALAEVILPYLRRLGERWARGEVDVGQEHFAANVIHGRLLSLTRKWDQGNGHRALLACPSGELHTIGLLCFGLALRTHGWRITYLGADTPLHVVDGVADRVDADLIVLSTVRSDIYADARAALGPLAAKRPVALGGDGAQPELAEQFGAWALTGDAVGEAAHVAATPLTAAAFASAAKRTRAT
jgi:MerR family transcriptional regulator, light-induced transcriptional regulator